MKETVFTQITAVDVPASVSCDTDTHRNVAFTLSFDADGSIPFPQVIVRCNGSETVFPVSTHVASNYKLDVPAGSLPPGSYQIQIEGCRKANIAEAGGDDWVKHFENLEITAPAKARKKAMAKGSSSKVKIYFGIHKHMHQPYYRAADTNYWDGEKDEIFGTRAGPYRHFVPCAVNQYESGGLSHGGLSSSWSGTLIEQLDRCDTEGMCGGAFGAWADELTGTATLKTSRGNPRLNFSAFGFFHPLMPLIPERDIVKNIEWHRDIIRSRFGTEASRVLFPPETAFHVRMIPALKKAGIEAVIYDSIHRFRACKNYPYAGKEEGMLPPNESEQENPEVDDWLQLNNIWAPSKISPSSLRPEYVQYEDPDGEIHKIIAVPAERYIGNEDARGGYGALQYENVMGQLYDDLVYSGEYDEKHPPFFLLHSDGDNYGGGTDSYYMHNTGGMVQWLQNDPRFELCTAEDYLEQFPPDPEKAIHIEPGSWAGADNGDPQYMKWFSRYHEAYSPDLNSWAVLTAFQNIVHAFEDANLDQGLADKLTRYLLTAETSCYWYWTGQDLWDQQVTDAVNAGMAALGGRLEELKSKDDFGPTIFAPWVTPENPGGLKWGNNCLENAETDATIHTFIYDLTGLSEVKLVLRQGKKETVLPMQDDGVYPSQTGAAVVGQKFTCVLPEGSGDCRYYIEAKDNAGNVSRSALERIYVK